MISKKAYREDRSVDIKEEGPAIFGQTIVNRLLKAKTIINGDKKIVSYKTLGKVIDLVQSGRLYDIVSLTRRQKMEIVRYLKSIGVLEYLGIEEQNNTIIYN